MIVAITRQLSIEHLNWATMLVGEKGKGNNGRNMTPHFLELASRHLPKFPGEQWVAGQVRHKNLLLCVFREMELSWCRAALRVMVRDTLQLLRRLPRQPFTNLLQR